jgi:hypothetical protein
MHQLAHAILACSEAFTAVCSTQAMTAFDTCSPSALCVLQELRKQNEQYRQDLEQQDQRAQKEQEAALARKQEQHEEELKQLQAQVG